MSPNEKAKSASKKFAPPAAPVLPAASEAAASTESSALAAAPLPAPGAPGARTPLYQAHHAARYQRQSLVKRIEQTTGSALICYVAGSAAGIERDDTLGFVDLLHNIPRESNLDLMMHTGGGDIDAAEKLINLVRATVGTARLRVIVPDYAKSAGTLIALGADSILMSDSSELGPIDPQIILADGSGNRMSTPVLSYIEAYETHRTALTKDPNDVSAQIMLSKLDPARLKLFEAAVKRARHFAESQLKRGMFRNSGQWSKAAGELLDPNKWESHGQMISWKDASDPSIGLVVDYVEPANELWRLLWELYCLQRLAVKDGQKLFESTQVSLVVDA